MNFNLSLFIVVCFDVYQRSSLFIDVYHCLMMFATTKFTKVLPLKYVAMSLYQISRILAYVYLVIITG